MNLKEKYCQNLKKSSRSFQVGVHIQPCHSRLDKFINNSFSLCRDRIAILRTLALIVFAHPYCARKFMSQWCHVIHRARARRNTLGARGLS